MFSTSLHDIEQLRSHIAFDDRLFATPETPQQRCVGATVVLTANVYYNAAVSSRESVMRLAENHLLQQIRDCGRSELLAVHSEALKEGRDITLAELYRLLGIEPNFSPPATTGLQCPQETPLSPQEPVP